MPKELLVNLWKFSQVVALKNLLLLHVMIPIELLATLATSLESPRTQSGMNSCIIYPNCSTSSYNGHIFFNQPLYCSISSNSVSFELKGSASPKLINRRPRRARRRRARRVASRRRKRRNFHHLSLLHSLFQLVHRLLLHTDPSPILPLAHLIIEHLLSGPRSAFPSHQLGVKQPTRIT